MHEVWPWILLGLLGAYHGLNPAMGWLFAVALGMQEGDRRAVVRALPAIATAHGAGLMVAPVLIGAGAVDSAAASDHAISAVQANGLSIPGSVLGITLHVAAMLAVMWVVALMVYDHVGVGVLKKTWINLDAV